MIAFKPPEVSDRIWVDELFFAGNRRGCESSFTNTYCWQKAFCQSIARVDDYVVQHIEGPLGECYLFPVGRGELRPVIDALRADAQSRHQPFRLVCVQEEDIARLEALYPGEFVFSEDRHGFDYLYHIDKLADLKGKKLHGKRNHIHRFEENCPDWQIEPVTQGNLAECLAMDIEWYRLNRGFGDAWEEHSLGDEGYALRLAIRRFTELALEGVLLRVEGRVIAFTLGRRLNDDTFDVNFEKAYSDIQGAYPMINREFARWIRENHPEIVYLNREDDMGVEGLRKAKLSYYPDMMVKKYTAQLIAEQ